ncbi:PUA domain [Trypanosoma melophagium]|uniref:PUA domain n=1 Tax=Trypanosoma melophagium TaxID=715481 RepID=UPI00351AA5F0|nr:PUA domain [Trypanosoma melophagium]
MISLLTFAEGGAYKYASPVTQNYIQSTVFTPLGFDAFYTSTFALPPCTTNVRFVGAGTQTLAAQANRAVERLREYNHIHAQTLDAWGMPYCISIVPVTEETMVKAKKEEEIKEEEKEDAVMNDDCSKDLPVVVVDAGCAEAVLRGSDVFPPGVVSVKGACAVGQRVHLAIHISHTKTESPEEVKSSSFSVDEVRETKEEGKEKEVLLVCVGGGTAMMDRRTMLHRQHGGIAVRNEWTPKAQPSKTLLSKLLNAVADDAVQNITTDGALSSTIAEEKEREVSASIGEEEEGSGGGGGGRFFLQNYSSMVAVELLMQQLRYYVISDNNNNNNNNNNKPLALLDACAAPGGKTSLLLSLLYETTLKSSSSTKSSEEHLAAAPHLTFTVTCCERSPLRYKRLYELLQRHFGTSFVESVVRPVCGDVNKLQGMQGKTDAGESSEHFFHGILLDPPCTGTGLRPKLTPHNVTLQFIRDCADYQRKLLDSCVKMLSRTGTSVLVYSTCSITLDENESNVLWALKKYPFLRLARARSEYDRELCLIGAANFSQGCRFLLQDEIKEAQRRNELICLQHNLCTESDVCEEQPLMVLRFMPGLVTGDEDGIGFFVAVFISH